MATNTSFIEHDRVNKDIILQHFLLFDEWFSVTVILINLLNTRIQIGNQTFADYLKIMIQNKGVGDAEQKKLTQLLTTLSSIQWKK